jgi:hypothetical protein
MKTQVKRTPWPTRGRSRQRPALAAAFLAAAIGWSILVPSDSQARVNPLVIIERQIHKANMLVVLDTSGSMTGVPGGQFYNSTEAGVDCDNGANCRNGGVLGVCQAWGKTCQSNDECRQAYCQKDGRTLCSTSADCPQDPNYCSTTTGPCAQDSDCPLQSGACSLTAGTCTSSSGCPSAGKCKYTNAVCTNPGGYCPNIGICTHSTSTTCSTPADCPGLPGNGTCSLGGTPRHGCTGNSDCPSYKQCNLTGDNCSIDTDCPHGSSGTCSGNGNPCSNKNKCPSGQTCVYPAQTCTGNDNLCVLPQDTCVTKTDNTCTAASNTCSAPSNTCIIPPTNVCVQPASSTDVCMPSSHGTPGPIRMCRLAQTVCQKDSDCTTSGDACGPATSRAVIAKRAISAIVNNNYKILNFGLMTFYQSGYFPYFLSSGGGTTGTITTFAPVDKIASSHCWDNHTGPTQTCRIDGVNMTLRSSADSRYRVRTGPSTWIEVDADWCGHVCDLPQSLGFGQFEGAYYEFNGTTGGNSTTMITQATYGGQTITVGGSTYNYYQPLNNYYNGGNAPPLDFPNCGWTCSATCGGRWDTQLAPFLSTTDDEATSQNAATAIARDMAPAANGGLIFFWGTPTGCTLQNDVSQTIHTSAYSYMTAVKNGDSTNAIPADHIACRDNYVLLITDGAANGPGDSNCTSAACAASNPVSAGCTCKSVLAAYNLRNDLGVKTFVVGFSGDVSAGDPRTINDNIARAGGTDADGDGVAPFAFLAQNEDELNTALQMVIYNAVRGSYSTAPTSSSAGTQQATTVAEGRYALDSRMDFPQWKGHLLAYDLLTNGTPCVNNPQMMCPNIVWDAYTVMQQMDWKSRRIYTWDGTNMVKFQVAADGTVTNQAALAALGLGSTPQEAGQVVHWVMGDPAYGNPAILGAIVNSTPIDIASPGDVPLPGGHDFFLRYQNRPHLVYVGSSDGMLHAFFLENTPVGSTVYLAGTEAFAFVPPEMLTIIRQQYGQGGQRPSPYDHIFGLADSPKAKSMCVSGCTDASTAIWKTLLLQTEGYGGNRSFVLDVTAPFSATGIADPPVQVQWHTDYSASASTYGTALGETISLPAFLFNKTSTLDDFRLIFTSGYPPTVGSSTTQGRQLITAAARNGTIVTQNALTPNSACTIEYTNLTDVATARDFARNQNDKILAGYFGDTHGQLWRYTLGGPPTVAMDFTCNHPLHFAPTVVQLDRDSLSSGHAHEIYPVQVTNSNLDFDTIALPPSKMIFWKDVATTDDGGNITGVSRDLTWNNNVGKIELTVGVDSQICGVTQVDAQGHVTCQTSMPITARPTATPLGLLKSDASGFQVFTMWYAPSQDSCTRGETYFTIHEALAGGTVTEKVGAMVAAEPVTSPVVMHGQILLFGAGGAYNITGLSPSTVSAGLAIPPPATGSGDGFLRYNWTEILQ